MTKNSDDLTELLRIVKYILDDEHIIFWLDCGTLLGAIRDGKFIPWDRDIDIGVWNEQITLDIKKSIINKFRKRGLYVNNLLHNNINIGLRQVWCDINFYNVIDDQVIFYRKSPKNIFGKILSLWIEILNKMRYYNFNYLIYSKSLLAMILKTFSYIIFDNLPLRVHYKLGNYLQLIYHNLGSKNVPWITPYKYLESFNTINYYGMNFLIPNNVNAYLSHGYGEDWTIPKKNVNWLEQV